MEENVVKHAFEVTRAERNQSFGHQSLVLWFTGLSGSGKSTIANALEVFLVAKGYHAYILDGDNVRKGLNSNLSFSPEDRTENIRRIGEVANLMFDAGLIVLSAFVSPYKKDRAKIAEIVGEENFIEVFVNTPIEECERRDVKGLYAKARQGEILNFTGISAPYEAPVNALIEIDTTQQTIENCVEIIFSAIENKLKLNNE